MAPRPTGRPRSVELSRDCGETWTSTTWDHLRTLGASRPLVTSALYGGDEVVVTHEGVETVMRTIGPRELRRRFVLWTCECGSVELVEQPHVAMRRQRQTENAQRSVTSIHAERPAFEGSSDGGATWTARRFSSSDPELVAAVALGETVEVRGVLVRRTNHEILATMASKALEILACADGPWRSIAWRHVRDRAFGSHVLAALTRLEAGETIDVTIDSDRQRLRYVNHTRRRDLLACVTCTCGRRATLVRAGRACSESQDTTRRAS